MGEEPVLLGGVKERCLVAALAVHCGDAVSAASLVDALWGDDPPWTAAKTLHPEFTPPSDPEPPVAISARNNRPTEPPDFLFPLFTALNPAPIIRAEASGAAKGGTGYSA